MKLRVKYSAAARKDIVAIKKWTFQNFGSAQAKNYVRQIERVMILIAENPGLAKDASEINPGLSRTLAGSHIVCFRIADEGVNVVRVLHARMDPLRWI